MFNTHFLQDTLGRQIVYTSFVGVCMQDNQLGEQR
jgi:hypothetical protein